MFCLCFPCNTYPDDPGFNRARFDCNFCPRGSWNISVRLNGLTLIVQVELLRSCDTEWMVTALPLWYRCQCATKL